jgi:hypothetical protein
VSLGTAAACPGAPCRTDCLQDAFQLFARHLQDCILTIKQKPVEVVAAARVTYVKLTPDQVEAQKRFGFTSDNIKVRAKFGTLFTNHGITIPQLMFLKVSNEIQLETDLTFAKQ